MVGALGCCRFRVGESDYDNDNDNDNEGEGDEYDNDNDNEGEGGEYDNDNNKDDDEGRGTGWRSPVGGQVTRASMRRLRVAVAQSLPVRNQVT